MIVNGRNVKVHANIGTRSYYSTTRDEFTLTDDHNDIFDLYQALVDKYGGKKTPYEVKYTVAGEEKTFTNFAYEFNTREYPEVKVVDGEEVFPNCQFINQYGNNPAVKKPKYLILSGIHGTERKAVYSTYKFIRDVLRGHNVPPAFREGVTISVMPVGDPEAFDAFTRYNQNGYTYTKEDGKEVTVSGVDINRNFGYDWQHGIGTDAFDKSKKFSCGKFAESEKETKAIVAWMKDNTDADLFIDYHNSSAMHEKVAIMGLPENDTSYTLRKIAMRGVDRVIPFWRDVLQYHSVVESEWVTDIDKDGDKIEMLPVIYSYTATPSGGGMAFGYAHGVLSIPSLAVETPSYYGSYYEWMDDRKYNQPEAIAMGAEALGNILIEFYNSEVKKMKNFRVETGSYFPDETINGTTTITLSIPQNAKAFEFYADGLTMEKLYAIGETGTEAEKAGKFITSAIGTFFTQHTKCVTGYDQQNKEKQYGVKSAINHIQNIGSVYGWDINPGTTSFTRNQDGSISFSAYGILKGNYHWVAYCWD